MFPWGWRFSGWPRRAPLPACPAAPPARRTATWSSGTTAGADRAMAESDARAKPRAWGVLAVTLALMALVAALSSATGHSSIDPAASHDRASAAAAHGSRSTSTGSHRPSSDRPEVGHGTRSATPESAKGDRSTIDVGHLHGDSPTDGAESPAPGGPVTVGTPLGSLGTPGEAQGLGSLDGASVGVASRSAATAAGSRSAPSSSPGAAHPPGTPTGAADADTPAASIETGQIGPTGSATYEASGGGTVTADANWNSTISLELSISCPGGLDVARTGSSGLSVVVDDTHRSGDCAVVLSAPPETGTVVAYSLTIEPPA